MQSFVLRHLLYNTHVISCGFFRQQKKVGNMKIATDWNFFCGYCILMLDIQTMGSVQAQKEFFLTDHSSQNCVVKKIVVGKGLQQKLLFVEKNELLPVPWKKKMLSLVSLLKVFLLTTLFFFKRKILPEIHLVKHKWQVLGRPHKHRGLREKMRVVPDGGDGISNQTWFCERVSTCVLPPKYLHSSISVSASWRLLKIPLPKFPPEIKQQKM